MLELKNSKIILVIATMTLAVSFSARVAAQDEVSYSAQEPINSSSSPNWKSVDIICGGGECDSISISPDRRRFAAVGRDEPAKIWQLGQDGIWSPTALEAPPSAEDLAETVTRTDGSYSTIIGGGKVTSKSVETIVEYDPNWAEALAFTPDGKSIFAMRHERPARLWREAGNGSWTYTVMQGLNQFGSNVELSPSVDTIITYGRGISLWTQNADGIWNSQDLDTNKDRPDTVAFSPDGTSLLVAYNDDNRAYVWSQTSDGDWASKALNAHTDTVNTAVFFPDGMRVLTTSEDGFARVWIEDEDGFWYSTALEGHQGGVSAAALSADGKSIVTASDDDTLRIWTEDEDGFWNAEIINEHGKNVVAIAFSLDEQRLFVSAGGGYSFDAYVIEETAPGIWEKEKISENLGKYEAAILTSEADTVLSWPYKRRLDILNVD